jgi:hypothetical protein
MRIGSSLLLLLVLAACNSGGSLRTRSDAATPRYDAWLPRHDTGPYTPPPGTGGCADGAQWIYLVDASRSLLRYEPDSGAITRIGTLACTPSATPFSMAVDRNAVAYVLHTDGRLYQASTTDASCASTAFAPAQHGFELFGMGFVSDAPGSADETLFIGGGPESGIGSGRSTLGRIDAAWRVAPVGPVLGSPELTGTGDAELWGFFPDASPMAVRLVDKATGGTLRELDVSALDRGARPTAWAFAYWGGRFYVFLQTEADASTNIWRVTEETGVVERVRSDIGYRIVGAGVSTCAPTELI